MYRFSDSVVKITLPKCVFVEELNWGRGTHEYYKYHENWATRNSNDSKVFVAV